jgi:hypothetical protein
MPRDPEVDAFVAELGHPLDAAIRSVREVVLEVDARIGETIKWKSPTFVFEGNIASIDPRSKKHVSLMFHQGAKLPGTHPELEGGGATVRYMRFVDEADVERKRAHLERAVRAWIALKEGEAS